MRKLIALCLVLVLLPRATLAFDPTPAATAAVDAFHHWMDRNGIKAGAIAVGYDGAVIATDGRKRDAASPAKLASLSKAITAVCALKALEASGLSHDATLSDIIPEIIAANPPRDAAMAQITIANLITHESGIESRYHATQLEKLRSFTKENKEWQFSKIASELLSNTPGFAGYHYSNANYLILGLVIEVLSGEAYEGYCQRQVLEPLGIKTGKLDNDWRVMSAWGGWTMSAQDYLIFAMHYFSNGNHFSAGTGISLPVANIDGQISYGPGVLFRRTGLGTNVWHVGSWKWRGRVRDEFGAYFAVYDNGLAVAVNYADDAYEAWRDLDTLLWRATHQ